MGLGGASETHAPPVIPYFLILVMILVMREGRNNTLVEDQHRSN
jgi:hypothetical protein